MKPVELKWVTALMFIGLTAVGPCLVGAENRQAPPGPIAPSELESFIDGLMAGQMKAFRIAGATFSLVMDGKILLAKGYGLADVDEATPVVAGETLFRCASVSKLFTWTAVMQLVERGRLDLEADINSYGAFDPIPATFPQPITLENLMAHNAGFEDLVSGLGSVDPRNLLPLDQYLRRYRPKRIYPPGRVTAYSNYSTCLAGAIVAKVSGLPFETYVEENILKPLDMTRSSFRQPLPRELAARMSKGYRFRRGVYEPQPFEYINVGPAGALSSTAVDMAHFMIAHLQNGLYGNHRILEESTARFMHARHFGNDPRATGNAHGFWERQLNGLRWISHGGDTLFFHSYLILCPDRQFGFFVCYNTITGAGDAREDLVQAILDRYLPQPAAAKPSLPSKLPAEARSLLGTYGATRTAASNYEKSQLLLLNIRISATPQGTLLTSFPFGLGSRQWRQVKPWTFREVGGKDVLVFKPGSRGEPTEAFVSSIPLLALVKLPWYKNPTLHWVLLSVALAILLSTLFWPLRAIARWACRGPKPDSAAPRFARGPAVIMSLMFAGFFAALFATVLGRPEVLMAGAPALLKKMAILAFLAAALLVPSALVAVRAWRRRYWTRCGRAYYTLVVIAGLALTIFIVYWKLVIFRP